jgi:hypothetical protein
LSCGASCWVGQKDTKKDLCNCEMGAFTDGVSLWVVDRRAFGFDASFLERLLKIMANKFSVIVMMAGLRVWVSKVPGVVEEIPGLGCSRFGVVGL